MSRTKAEDCNKRKLFDEVQAHQFDWHTTEGLIEDLSSHCNGEDYLTKNVSEQIDLLLKKYRTLSRNRRWPCHLLALQSVLIIKTWTWSPSQQNPMSWEIAQAGLWVFPALAAQKGGESKFLQNVFFFLVSRTDIFLNFFCHFSPPCHQSDIPRAYLNYGLFFYTLCVQAWRKVFYKIPFPFSGLGHLKVSLWLIQGPEKMAGIGTFLTLAAHKGRESKFSQNVFFLI